MRRMKRTKMRIFPYNPNLLNGASIGMLFASLFKPVSKAVNCNLHLNYGFSKKPIRGVLFEAY